MLVGWLTRGSLATKLKESIPIDALFIVAVLAANVAISEWLAEHTWLRHLGAALLVILLTAVVANLGWIPTVGQGSPVYDGIFEVLAPMAIFWLLLQVNLGSIRRAGAPMILLFLIGTAGTVIGVLVGLWVVGGDVAFGELTFALAGMFVGTYTGGSINFNAVALEYGVVDDGLLYAGASVVDSAVTTIWMAACVFLPRLFLRRQGVETHSTTTRSALETVADAHEDSETIYPIDLAILVALGAASVWFSGLCSTWAAEALGITVPSILILTTIALVLAQLEPVRRLRGAHLVGWFAVMIFLAVIGALCDIAALGRMGALGLRMSLFAVIAVAVHGAIVFGAAPLLRQDPVMAAVASQANVGGGTSALALAKSLGRSDLVLPGILIGSLGNGLGTYLGFMVAAWMR